MVHIYIDLSAQDNGETYEDLINMNDYWLEHIISLTGG